MDKITASREIMTREEVMEFLKIGKSTFYKLLHSGKIKGFKEGNRFKIPARSVEEYVEQKLKL